METEKRLQKLKNKSRIISALLCICMLLCICSCTNEAVPITEEPNSPGQSENVTETKAPKDTTDYSEHSFAVHYIDVGQGDAALVLCDDKTMLIDGGKPHASSIIYTYLKNLNIDYLDYIVASHADDDHIGGLSAPLAKMKVGHHGSKNSTTYPFLREIMPKYAVISVGDNNYGHPTEDTLSRLRDADVKVYRTDMQGDIVATSDGKTVTVTTKKKRKRSNQPDRK